jgi:arsenate reductase
MLNVLFLCTRNSTRSIIAESLMRSVARGRFNACSAGLEPAPRMPAEVLDFLQERQLPVEGLRPKSWREFTASSAPKFGFVIALTEPAAAVAASHPWEGDPVVAHWTAEGAEAELEEASGAALRDTFWVLSRRIKIFASLPHGKATRRSLEKKLKALESWQ